MAMNSPKLVSNRYDFVQFIKKIPLTESHVTLEDEFNCQIDNGNISCHHVVIGKVNNVELIDDNTTAVYLTEVLPDGICGSAFVLCIRDQKQMIISVVKENDFFGFSNADVKQVSLSSLFGFSNIRAYINIFNKDIKAEIWRTCSQRQDKNDSKLLTVQDIPSYKDKGCKVTLFGVLRSFTKRKHALTERKEQLILHTYDEHGDIHIVLHYNLSQSLPKLEMYCVIMIQNMQILQDRDGCFGYITHPESLFVFEREDHHPEVVYTASHNYKASDSQILRVRLLRSWMRIQDWYPWRDENFGTTWLLKDIYKPGRYKLLCRVMNIRQMKGDDTIVLTVADGTSCHAFVKKCSDPLNVSLNDVISDKNDFFADESEVDIFITDVNNSVMSLKKGHFITIGDIIVINAFQESLNIEDSHSAIENFMIFLLNKDSYTGCKIHSDREEKILKRKLNEKKSSTSFKIPKPVSVVELEPAVHDVAQSNDSIPPPRHNNEDMTENNEEPQPATVDNKSKENPFAGSNTCSSITHFSGASIPENIVISDNMHVTTDESLIIQTANDVPNVTHELLINDTSPVEPSFSFVHSDKIVKSKKFPTSSRNIVKHSNSDKLLAPCIINEDIAEDEVSDVGNNRHDNVRNTLNAKKDVAVIGHEQGDNIRHTLSYPSTSHTKWKPCSRSSRKAQQEIEHYSSLCSRTRESRTDNLFETSDLENREITDGCKHCEEVELAENEIIENEHHMKGRKLNIQCWILRVLKDKYGRIAHCICAQCKSEVDIEEGSIYCKKCYSSPDDIEYEEPECTYNFTLAVIDKYQCLYKVLVSDYAAVQLLGCTAAAYLQDKKKQHKVHSYLNNLVLTDPVDKPLRMKLKGVFKYVENNFLHLIDVIQKPQP